MLVPAGGAHLYLADVDSYYPNNAGAYDGALTVLTDTAVPEPSSLMLLGSGAVITMRHLRSRRRKPAYSAQSSQHVPFRPERRYDPDRFA